MKKHTIESLKQQGFKGYQYNTMTGNLVEANYPLDNMAWTMNNRPDRIRSTNDDLGGIIRLHIENENWTPSTNLEVFVERPMTEQELQEADARLAKMGVTVERAPKKFPSLDEIIKEASKRSGPGDPPPGGGAPAKEFTEEDKEKMEESKKPPQPRFISPSR